LCVSEKLKRAKIRNLIFFKRDFCHSAASHQMYLESKFTLLLERAILDLLEAQKDKEIAVAASNAIQGHLRRQNIDPGAVLPSLVKQKSNQADEAGDGIFVSSSLRSCFRHSTFLQRNFLLFFTFFSYLERLPDHGISRNLI
jgi:hypothetical protein